MSHERAETSAEVSAQESANPVEPVEPADLPGEPADQVVDLPEPAQEVPDLAGEPSGQPPEPAAPVEEPAGRAEEPLDPAEEPVVPGLAEAELRAALEAVLLVVDEPVADSLLAQVLEEPTERVAEQLAALSAEYTAAGRGFDLRRAAGGWRLYTRAEQAPYVQRFVLDGQQTRLTQAALETLAVIAYRQPVTRSRVSAIRGVNCDGVIRTLLSRGLVEEVGTEPETGAYLYRTTGMFLEKLGLDSLEQLPPLAPFLPDDVDALDPDVLHPDAPEPARTPAAAPAVAAEPEPDPGLADEPEPVDPAGPEPVEASEPVEPAEPADQAQTDLADLDTPDLAVTEDEPDPELDHAAG